MNVVARILSHMAPIAALTGLALSLCACVSLPDEETPGAQLDRATAGTDQRIDAGSAASAAIARIAAEPGKMPTFQDIPTVPTDVRTPMEWRRSVLALESAGDQLARESAPDTFTLHDTDGFAANTRGQLDAGSATPPTAAEIAASAAFVKAARARATPPPRPH